MKITRMRANHLAKPLGYDLSDLSLSWVAESEKAKTQKWARVRVGLDDRLEQILHDSGKQENIDSLAYQPELKLMPRTRYYWNVEVEGDNGEAAVSETAWFETGKMTEEWVGKWITPALPADIHPYMRRGFELEIPVEDIVSARVYASAAGIYEMYLNGEKLSEEYLLPGFHSYDCWMQYQTFDVTEKIRSGINLIGAMVGKGWYSGRFGLTGTVHNYGERMALLAELVITGKDGTTQVVSTDTSWQSHRNPITESSIFDGEHYDARLEMTDWCVPAGIAQTGWQGVEEIVCKIGPMAERMSPPIRKQEHFSVKELILSPKAEIILDFGQNMTGWVEFEADVPQDTHILLQYAEILQDGCLYRGNLRSAKEEFEYISSGKRAWIRPHFTYYGFRYVKVEITSPEGKQWSLEEAGLQAEDFTAWVIHSDMLQTAWVETSDARVNRLITNALWSQKSNFLDVPTDCPQRDERQGWTGDAQIFCGTASYFMDTAAFFAKYMRDVREEQLLLDGSIPFVVPNPKLGKAAAGHGSCGWADVATVIPWTQYLYYGDKSMLAKQYDTMRDWVEYIKKQDEADGGRRLWQTGYHFADWLALDNYMNPETCMGGTDCFFIASAYYYYSTKLTADAAEILGKIEDAVKYRKLQQEIKTAFQREYITPNGRIAERTQTAQVVALFFDLLPKEHRGKAAETLKKMIKTSGMHLNTGFVGTPYLCRVLSAEDGNDYAYRLLLREDFPSWLYQVRMGATTIWESWDAVAVDGHMSGAGLSSLNHYAYGSVVEWIMRDVCGINPVLDQPGFRKVVMKPQPYGLLDHAKMVFDSPCGRYACGWELKEEEGASVLAVNITVPFQCTVEFILPGMETRTLEAGTYAFTFPASSEWLKCLSVKSSLKEVITNDQGKKVLRQFMPSLVQAIESGMLPIERQGEQELQEVLKMLHLRKGKTVPDELLVNLNEELIKIRT